MITATHRVTEIRFCADAVGDDMPAYSLSCNLVWESHSVVWVTMMQGCAKRHHLRELEDWLRDCGVRLIKAHRVQGHILPGFKAVAAHFEREISQRKAA